MKNIHNNIITCASFGGTGSSVVTDLLKEFSEVNCLGDYEFALAHEVDGISDLEHYLVGDFHRLKADEGIYRFIKLTDRLSKEYELYFNSKFLNITKNYIENITDVSWDGYWHQHGFRYNEIARKIKYRVPERIQRLKHKVLDKDTGYEYVPVFPKSPMKLGYGANKFYKCTKEYTESLINELNQDKEYKYIALDQLVPPTNTNRYLNYFYNLKIVVVDRDPRDLYLLNKMFWKEGWIPTENIDEFIKWFKLLRQPLENEIDNEEKVLRVRFEEFIYNYDETINLIVNFIGLDKNLHTKKKKHFDPKRSAKNCKLWEKYDEYKVEINMIENELKKYCYN